MAPESGNVTSRLVYSLGLTALRLGFARSAACSGKVSAEAFERQSSIPKPAQLEAGAGYAGVMTPDKAASTELNTGPNTLMEALGIEVTLATPERVEATMTVSGGFINLTGFCMAARRWRSRRRSRRWVGRSVSRRGSGWSGSRLTPTIYAP